MTETKLVRLQKHLAAAGVASRRRSEELIAHGRVTVDGEIVDAMGVKIDSESAVVHVDGKRVPPVSPHAYVVLNKPRGVVSTMSDPEGRRCLGDLVADRAERLFHVGRLDTDTDGLILLTNHGELAHRLAHPSFEIVKTYVAEVEGHVQPKIGARLRHGIDLEDGHVRVDSFTIVQTQPEKSLVRLEIHVGRNRIVRRMLASVGHPVVRLSRVRLGDIHLGELKSGSMRELTSDELGALLDSVGL